MRSRFPATGLALLLTVGATPGRVTASETAAGSGLLLGVCGEECETLWVTAPGGAWQVAARGRGIVTPRRSGFWRVGISRPADEKDWFRWLLWASPAGEPLHTVRDTAWDEASIEELRHFGGVRHVELSFVGPDHVATSETFETHGPQINYNHNLAVQSLDALAHPQGTDQLWSGLPIGEVLGAEAERVFAFAAQSALRDSESEGDRDMYGESFLENASSAWIIARGRGRWVATGSSGYGSGAARGFYYQYPVPVAVPPRVVGFEEEAVPWELVVEEFPDAIDVYASPARDVLVVKAPGRLLVCPRTGEGRPGRPLATLSIPERAATVMVQWALGSSVGRWTRELVSLLAAPPPAPQIVPAPDAEAGKTRE
jgi:hypothetical protein